MQEEQTFQASLPDVVLVDEEVFVSVQVPASARSLLLGRGRVGSVGQVVQVVPATRPYGRIYADQGLRWETDQSGELGQSTL